MADFLPKNLGNGQLPNTKTTLYTVPGGANAILRSVSLVNTSASEVTVNIYANFGAGSRRIIPKDLSMGAGEAVGLDMNVTLDAATVIEGDAATASVIDYVLSGAESV